MVPVAIKVRCALGRAAAHTRVWGRGLASQGTAIATSLSTATSVSATTSAATPTATIGPSKQKPKTKKPTTAYFVGGLPPDSTAPCRFVEYEKARPSWTVERLVREALPWLGLLGADGKAPLSSDDAIVFNVSAKLATSPSTTAEQLSSGGKRVALHKLLREVRCKAESNDGLNNVFFYAKAKPQLAISRSPQSNIVSHSISERREQPASRQPTQRAFTFARDVVPIATKVTVQELEGGNGAAVLSLPEGINWPSLQSNRLFKRDFYDRFIAENLYNFNNSPHGGTCELVMGSPDSGKSSFALYCVWTALQMGKTVVYQHHGKPTTYVVFMPGIDTALEVDNASPLELKRRDTVLIADGVAPHGAEAFTLFITSPNREKVHMYDENVIPHFFPTWSLEELKLLRTHCFEGRSRSSSGLGVALTDEELQCRYDAVGGMLRPIFLETAWEQCADVIDQNAKKVAFLIKEDNIADINIYLPFDQAIRFGASRSTFKLKYWDFASPQIRQRIAQELDIYDDGVLQKYLNKTRYFDYQFVAIREFLFELLVHRNLTHSRDPWAITCCQNTSKGMLSIPTFTSSFAVLHMPLPSRPATHFDRVEDIQLGEPNVAMLWYNAALDHRLFIVTVGAHVYFLQCDVCTVYKDVRSQRFAHIAYPEGVGAGAVAVSPALLPLAAALALRGFDTAGDIILVHVKETHNKFMFHEILYSLRKDESACKITGYGNHPRVRHWEFFM